MVSEDRAPSEKEDSMGRWSRDHSFYVLAEKFSAFCPCPETFCKADFRSNGFLNLAKEMSRQHSIQEVAWILLETFSQIIVIIRSRKPRKIFKMWTLKARVKLRLRNLQLLKTLLPQKECYRL